MAQGKASARELATAAGILSGLSISRAMADAGYSPSYARTNAGIIEAKLRELGLLPTPADAQDAIALLRQTIFRDGGRGLVRAYEAHLARAQAGDVGSLKTIMAYLVGAPAQAVQLTGAGGGPVAIDQHVMIEWPGDGQGDNASDPNRDEG